MQINKCDAKIIFNKWLKRQEFGLIKFLNTYILRILIKLIHTDFIFLLTLILYKKYMGYYIIYVPNQQKVKIFVMK